MRPERKHANDLCCHRSSSSRDLLNRLQIAERKPRRDPDILGAADHRPLIGRVIALERCNKIGTIIKPDSGVDNLDPSRRREGGQRAAVLHVRKENGSRLCGNLCMQIRKRGLRRGAGLQAPVNPVRRSHSDGAQIVRRVPGNAEIEDRLPNKSPGLPDVDFLEDPIGRQNGDRVVADGQRRDGRPSRKATECLRRQCRCAKVQARSHGTAKLGFEAHASLPDVVEPS